MNGTMKEVHDLANAIEELCHNQSTITVYLALAAVIGCSAARATRPDLPALMKVIGSAAQEAFDAQRSERPA